MRTNINLVTLNKNDSIKIIYKSIHPKQDTSIKF